MLNHWRNLGWLSAVTLGSAAFSFLLDQNGSAIADELERGFRNPPAEARPHAYWLWLNGYVDPITARAELQAMKEAGLGGVLVFDMGARGAKSVQPPVGPAFLSPPWMAQFRESVAQAKQLGLQVDLSVISSWDMGGHWIEPPHASMGLYPTETTFDGGRTVDVELESPPTPAGAPKTADGRPAFQIDVAVLGIRNAQRLPGHEFVFKLDPEGTHHILEVRLDNGNPGTSEMVTSTMTPTRDFSIGVSTTGISEQDFQEVVRGHLPSQKGSQHFPMPMGTKASYVRLRLLRGHDDSRSRWTLGEIEVLDVAGRNLAAARVADTRRNGAMVVRASAPLGYDQEWNQDNLHDGDTEGATGVFASAGLPPFAVSKPEEVLDLTDKVDKEGHLRWAAPEGRWTILRYVCMNTGERLKVPSPASDGWATDHLNPQATRAHMDYVVARLREALGQVGTSGLRNLYLASYEVRGPVWSPGFVDEFRRRRGYNMTPFLPAVFGARITHDDVTERFLFDYRKTLGEVLIDAYYGAARNAAHQAGLTIKSEAGGPGPPVHNVPVDALLANNAVDEIQGEFWPFWPNADGLWVVKETAAAGHLYGKPRVHLEAFTSLEGWREGPQDLKPSADRVFCEGGNHFVWHTWTHAPPEAGKPGWVYLAGTHLNRNVPWWPKARPFIDYLSRSSFLLQRGRFVADVLYYYGDGGYKFVGPRRNPPSLRPGYDYDVTNSDVILNRLTAKEGRLVLPDGTYYSVLVLPESQEINPAVLEKIGELAAAGATILGPRPLRAVGLTDYPASDRRVNEIAARIWGNLDGRTRKSRIHGKGRILWGDSVTDVLAGMGIEPDFLSSPSLDFIHRNDHGSDIYFIRNRTAKPVQETARFRVGNREPEFWDPRCAEIRRAVVYRSAGQYMEVPMELAPNGSVFVVFRRPAQARAIAAVSDGAKIILGNGIPVLLAERDGDYLVQRATGEKTTIKLAGIPGPLALDDNWSVEFEADRGAPQRIELRRLQSWTDHAESGVRFFSGTGRYSKTFTLPTGWRNAADRVALDFGDLWAIGEVWLNKKSLGVIWTAPFRVDCTAALRDASNELVVEVVNNWYNRLIGDARLPEGQRITRTNVTMSGGKRWVDLEPLPSGLLGPVRLIAAKQFRLLAHR